MRLDATLPPTHLNQVAEIAGAAESMGFDTLWASETMHDPFLPGALVWAGAGMTVLFDATAEAGSRSG